jgi:hypothetical protein
LVTAGELPGHDVLEHPSVLARYVAALEDPARPALKAEWADAGRLLITGPVRPGDLVAVQVNAADGWTARQDGRDVAWTSDRLGFLAVHASPAADTRIELRFEGTAEQRVMAAICGIAWAVAIGMWIRVRIEKSAGKPTRPTAP